MCRVVIVILACLYAVAVAAWFMGTFGLFGIEQDPLSGIFLIPLGLPWNLLVDLAPEPAWPWLAAVAPAINIALLWTLCRYLNLRR